MKAAPAALLARFFSRLRGLSYSMRFALILSAVFSVASITAAGVSYTILSDELRTRLFEDAKLTAVSLANILQTSGPVDLEDQLRVQAARDHDTSTLTYFVAPGRPGVGTMKIAAPFEGPRRLIAGRDFTVAKGLTGKIEEVYYAYGIRQPAGWVIAARDSQWVTDSQEVLVQSVAWGLVVALLASIIVAVTLARRNATRIDRLNDVLQAASEGDLAKRYEAPTQAQDDISQVARGVNQMLERLEASVERLTQVSADIAHDLRAPLTRLRIRLEPHAGRTDLPEDARRDIGQAIEAIEGIASTFDAILKLAQLEGGAAPISLQRVDLVDIATSIHEMLAPVADDLGHQLDLSVPGGALVVLGDQELLTQALVNLVDNAFRHCPAPTKVTIAVARSGDDAVISVCDSGPGIPVGEREKVTRRFYRMDASRNRQGTGLGLSLVAAIARLHGAQLELSDNAPGLCAEIHLPLAPADPA